MNTELLKARQTKYVGYATLYIVVTVAVLTVANILADRYNKSYDGTSNKQYTLSEQTAKIVKSLKEPATIYYYDRPNGFKSAKDTLDQYANLSPKVHVKYIDVEKDNLAARQAGVKNLGTAIVEIGARKEEAKGLTEEGITGAFIRDLKTNTRTVCFVTGSGEHRIDDSAGTGYSTFNTLLGRDEYQTKSISLLEKAEVPSECTVVVVGGPRGDYQQPEVDALKKYVENGGRAFFLLDPPLKLGRTDIADNDALATLLQSWGVTLDKDLILDPNPIGQLAGLGMEVALVGRYDSQPIVSDLNGNTSGFPISRSLEIKNADKTSVDRLFGSSSTSVAATKLDSDRINMSDPKNKKGPLTMAAAGTYKTGKENEQGRFVVVGSSEWAANGFIHVLGGNSDLALNAVNWLASDEELISIRPKERDDRTLTMTNAQIRWVGITSLLLLPLAVIATGVSVWWRRR
ncbi:MAG TPA: GldG family protein [Candidatus Methylomirabilis sp.]|nr:GldG family protein [Candidatus Methylomirabilis sp.]